MIITVLVGIIAFCVLTFFVSWVVKDTGERIRRAKQEGQGLTRWSKPKKKDK